MRRKHFLHVVAAAAALPASLAAGDWPCWRGPNHNGSAADSGAKLLDDPSKARLVWKSDQKIPGARVADGRKVVPKGDISGIGGGFASPVVAGGRVYVTYYVPNGSDELYDHRLLEKHKAGGYGAEKWWIDCDDVIHCFDAKTGRTLWKKTFVGTGMNYNLFNKGGPCNLTPCVADGKVYAVGSGAKVFCVDAATGEKVWDGDVGERYKRMEKLRAECKKLRQIPQYNRDMSSAPIVVDGVLICSDFLGYKVQQPLHEFLWTDQCGVVALDARTGRTLWARRKVLGNWASPVAWTHEGKGYVVTASADGKAWCFQPRTGKTLWQIETGKNDHTVAVGGGYLICNGGTDSRFVACYTISPAGAKPAWKLPTSYDYTGSTPPVIYDDHAYLMCKSGKLLCVELKTGRVASEIDVKAGGFLIAADRRLLLDAELGHDGDAVRMFAADPASFRQLGGVWAAPNATSYMNPLTPAYAGGLLYLRSHDGHIHCYDLRAT